MGHAPTPAPAPPPVFRLSTSGIPGCSRDFAERVGLELSGCLLHADIIGSGEGLAHGAGVKLGVSCPGMPDVSLSNSSRVLLNSQRIAPLSLLVTHLTSSVVAPVFGIQGDVHLWQMAQIPPTFALVPGLRRDLLLWSHFRAACCNLSSAFIILR